MGVASKNGASSVRRGSLRAGGASSLITTAPTSCSTAMTAPGCRCRSCVLTTGICGGGIAQRRVGPSTSDATSPAKCQAAAAMARTAACMVRSVLSAATTSIESSYRGVTVSSPIPF